MNNTISTKKTLNKRDKDKIFVACLVTLPLIHYLIFYVYVNINSIFLAFQRYENGAYVWKGFINFKLLWNEIGNGLLKYFIKNSLLYYVIHTGVGTTATLFFSYYIFKKRFASKLFKVILFLPSVISAISIALMYKYICDFAVPQIILKLFDKKIPALASNVNTVLPTVIFFGIWVGFGSGLLLYSGAMSNINDAVIEAAQIDGAGELRQFFSIVIPMIYPTLSVFIINGIAIIFTSDMHLYAFYGTDIKNLETSTVGYYLLRKTRSAQSYGEYNVPAAMGIALTAVSIPITFAARWLLNKFGPKVD